MSESLTDVAAWLIGRPLTKEDGVSSSDYAVAEQRLGQTLPPHFKIFT